VDTLSAVVSVIDLAAGRVVQELTLPSGSGLLNDIRVSPDGKFAVVTHLVASFHRPTTQVQAGWMNANAQTIIDLERLTVLATVLLDEPDSGAANPWGQAWSANGAQLVVAHAGTHEISVIDFPRLIQRLTGPSTTPGQGDAADLILAEARRYEFIGELPYLVGARQRIKLPATDRGPRAVLVVGRTAYVANYFSDTLSVIGLDAPQVQVESIPLAPQPHANRAREGEAWFNDASLCLQGWQSCASCHPGEARVDGLDWDLFNDGLGNPKNTKSLLLTHRTPPAMSAGVRAGIEHILFTKQPESVAVAIDAYLESLAPEPSPYRVRSRLSPAARRGEKVFRRAGCASCHPPDLFTDLQSHDVGTRRPFDKPTDFYDTPTLVEVWRTAPYLHDGSAATLREVFTFRNPHDAHGSTSRLSAKELDDLCVYVLSL